MAELIAGERLQPCLLDRLTDAEPDKVEEGRANRVMSMSRYRDGVMRDLRWLLSASNHLESEELHDYPAAEKSGLNFGVRNLCGHMSGSLDVHQLEREVIDAITIFEPRIDRRTLRVKFQPDVWNGASNELAFEIHGDLWAYPAPEQLYIKTKLDLETGDFTF